MTTRLLPSYATCRWLLIPVVALHNAEEWITVPRYGSIAPTLQDHLTGLFTPPAFRVLEISWIFVTLVPAVVVLAAASAGRSRVRDWLVCWVTSIYLANAFLPHLLEFVIDRSYAPGVLTAMLVNLPFAIVLLRRAVREQYLSGRQLAAAVAAGVVSLPILLAAVFAVASSLAAAIDLAA
ncbi:MAG TPA: HXXEE domain-containing protein [Steroidobacteraceae bacterium]|nr:HXXEE domain-containing protein [Steroidobacteraceae bacterium]